MESNISAMLASAGFSEDAPEQEVEMPAAEVEQPEVEAEVPESDDPEGEAGEEPEAKPEEPAKPWKKGPPETIPYKVLSERTAKFREREAELLAENEALRAGRFVPSERAQSPAPEQMATSKQPPSMDAFNTYEEFSAAHTEWLLQEAETRAIARIQQTSAAHSQEQQVVQAVQTFQQKLAEANQANPEIGEIQAYLQPIWKGLHPMVQQMIVESDDPASDLQALAEIAPDLESIHAIASRSPAKAIAMIGRISASRPAPVQAPKAAPREAAPPPMRTVKTQAAVTRKAVGDMSPSEIMKKYGRGLRS